MTRFLVTLTIAAAVQAQQPVFRSTVDVVRVDVSVMNGLTPVAGLKLDQFVLTDNGVPQKPDALSFDTVPLDLVLALDISGSMAGDRIEGLIDAASGLVQALRPDDRAALISFSEPIRQPVALTADRSVLARAIRSLTAAGGTSLNDAIFLALQSRPQDAGATRSVVLVSSDGRDMSSWLSDDQILEATRRSGVLVHVVELTENQWLFQSAFLDELASVGGGRRWFASSARDLRELFGKVLDELRSRYLLTYYPANVPREGWHDVKVTLKGARGDVTARPGYYVAPQ
jgi:Ca-activated chloride channel family protein